MPRPPAVPNEMLVDAVLCAQAGSTIERHFSADDLSRLREVGARAGSQLDAQLRFTQFDGAPVVRGKLRGRMVLTCQRCMKAAPVELDEGFEVIVLAEERSDEPGGYEPVQADASHLDLRWLVEEQVLLALPLVPMHENDCTEAEAPASQDEAVRQQPFQNLRDLMRQR
jgi:DUF177 domain-containing protein